MCVTSFLLVVLIILPPAGKVNSLGESFILCLQTGQKRMISFTKCSNPETICAAVIRRTASGRDRDLSHCCLAKSVHLRSHRECRHILGDRDPSIDIRHHGSHLYRIRRREGEAQLRQLVKIKFFKAVEAVRLFTGSAQAASF